MGLYLICPGLNRAELLAEFPGCQLEPGHDGQGWWRSQPYESGPAARRRAARLLTQTQAEFAATDHRVAYVMHGDFQLLFLTQFHSLPLVLALNASLTHVRVSPGVTELVDFNSIEHLPNHMITW
ncbi:MAG: histidine phosphatase family protein [Pirellulaceae bacterium]